MSYEEWNRAIEAAYDESHRKNYASPSQIKKLKNGKPEWDEAIDAAASHGTNCRFASPQQILALRK